jgi:hypothetical protein
VPESRITNTLTVQDFCVLSDEFNVSKMRTEVLLNDEHFKACLQKATVSFVMSICPLSTWNFGSHRMEFYEI